MARPKIINKGGLQQLQELLFNSPLDPVFIAIDFERTQFIINNFSTCSDTEVGISILDARNFNPREKVALKLKTYNFVTGSGLYHAKATKKFLWGTSEKIQPKEMLSCIDKLICRNRKIVLVGHGVQAEMAVLTALGFDFQPSIIAILDTSYISFELEISPCSLGRLLNVLECPISNSRLHNAGNDANFTLRALILLAIKAYKMQELNTLLTREDNWARIEALQDIATRPVLGVKQKTRKPRKKALAKIWSLEKQEEMREERRQRRATNKVLIFY